MSLKIIPNIISSMKKSIWKYWVQKAAFPESCHEDFIQKINEYTPDVIDENQKETLLELLDFLATWLVEHIYKQDKLIAE